MTPNNERERELFEAECLSTVNKTAALQSLLYDLDLLPEQLQQGTMKWSVMLAFGFAWNTAQSSLRAEYETKLAEAQARERILREQIEFAVAMPKSAEAQRRLTQAAQLPSDSSALDAITAPLEARIAELEGALGLCRKELDGLPHSLGYDFTHIPLIDAVLANKSPAESLERLKIRAKVEALDQAVLIAGIYFDNVKQTKVAHYRFSQTTFNAESFGFSRDKTDMSRDISDRLRRMAAELKAKL